MNKIRVKSLLNLLNRYTFTSDKLYFMENICKLNEYTKRDYDDVLEYFSLNPNDYMTKESKRQAIINYYRQAEDLW